MPQNATKPLRIALVVRPAAGGIRRHASLLLNSLDRERFFVTLFAPADFAADVDPPTTPHIRFDIPPKTNLFADRAVIHNLAQELDRNFDLIHAHGIRAAWIAGHAAFRLNIPFIFTAHNLVPRLNPLARHGLQFTSKLAVRILAVSNAVADSLQANGVEGRKIAVVSNGIDVAPFDAPYDRVALRARFGIAPDAPLIAAVGRLAPEKGFDVLIKAFPSVKRHLPDAQLLLVGDGPQMTALRHLAQNEEAVHFTGYVPNVVPIMQCADVAAIPSRQEGQGIVALEAAAASRPVVASRVGGLSETVMENATGLLVPAENSTALADALTALLQDAPRREAMGNVARERVEKFYAIAAMTAQTETIYKTAIMVRTGNLL